METVVGDCIHFDFEIELREILAVDPLGYGVAPHQSFVILQNHGLPVFVGGAFSLTIHLISSLFVVQEGFHVVALQGLLGVSHQILYRQNNTSVFSVKWNISPGWSFKKLSCTLDVFIRNCIVCVHLISALSLPDDP